MTLTNIESLVIDLLHNHVLLLEGYKEAKEQSLHMSHESLEGLRELAAKAFPEELPNLEIKNGLIDDPYPFVTFKGYQFKIKL
jgi:hypothetical protein